MADEVNREMRENCTGSDNNAILKILEAAREVPLMSSPLVVFLLD